MADDPKQPDYAVSPRTISLLLKGAVAVGALLLLALVLLMVVGPRGQFVEPDREEYQATVRAAQERLERYHEDPETGIVQVPIDRAMQLVAERGVDEIVFVAAAPPDEVEVPDGEAVYVAQCAACHQADGQGVAGAFPPLAGHVPDIYDLEGGRAWLIHVVLYGLAGEIEADGVTYDGVMPALPQLSDAEIAAVLNHIVTAWDNEELLDEPFVDYEPEEVAEERDLGLTAADVLEERRDLGLD